MCACPLGTWPATQACALTRNQTGDPLVLRMVLNPLSYTSQAFTLFVLILIKGHVHWFLRKMKKNRVTGRIIDRYMPWPGTRPTTSICALIENQTHNLLVYGTVLQQTEPPNQGVTTFLMSLYSAASPGGRSDPQPTHWEWGHGKPCQWPSHSAPATWRSWMGSFLPTALAAPLEAGMMFWVAPRPSCHSFPEGPSTIFWVAVMAWTMVMSPSTMPELSWMTLTGRAVGGAGGIAGSLEGAVIFVIMHT